MSNHERKGPPPRGECTADGTAQDTDRDAALQHAWQQASDELPPPDLDAAIIAAARKSVQDRGARAGAIHAGSRSRHRWMQWQPLAVAASVAGLAFVLVQLMPRDRDVAPSIRMEEPARGPATMEEKAGVTAPEAAVPRAAVEGEQGITMPTASVPQATAEKSADVSAPATSAADSATAMHAIEADQRESMAAEMAGAATPAAAAAPARERSSGNAALPSPADRAAGIAALYLSGDATGAADALRAFRAVDPDADKYLPDSLRAWARTVR